MAGISGAFLILPFQVSILHFTAPSVSATNLLYNVVGTPGGILRYIREGRMLWPLIICIAAGAVPGMFIGYYVRVQYFPNPLAFKFFVGLVLLVVGSRLLFGIKKGGRLNEADGNHDFKIENMGFSYPKVSYGFLGATVSFHVFPVICASVFVGTIGGIYGVGGSVLLAPFFVSVLKMPVHTVAGALLAANLLTSSAGVIFYSLIPFNNGSAAPPDFLLGLLFGAGGILGMYAGAKTQKYVSEKWIKIILGGAILTIALKYILTFLFRP